MSEELLRNLVWTDYRLAVLFTVLLPIVLLIWSLVRRVEAAQKLLIIYWRVASLLMITIYLMIPAWPIGFVTGVASRILIPIALWFWIDLNEEIRDWPRNFFKIVFTSWRWATTIYCILGVAATVPFLNCAFESGAISTPYCQVWIEPPRLYKLLVHPNTMPGFLGFLAVVGLTIYILYLLYFVFIRLGKQGRSALEQ